VGYGDTDSSDSSDDFDRDKEDQNDTSKNLAADLNDVL